MRTTSMASSTNSSKTFKLMLIVSAMGLQEKIAAAGQVTKVIYVPDNFGLEKSLSSRLQNWLSGVKKYLTLRFTPIYEADSPELKFAKSFNKLRTDDKKMILGLLQKYYCCVEGLDYHTIKVD